MPPVFRFFCFGGLFLLIHLGIPEGRAWAQEQTPSAQAPSSLVELPGVEIVSPWPPRLQAGGPTRLTADSLGRYSAAGWTLDAALRQVEGLYVRDYGGLTGLKTVSLRGLAANQTTLLLEGVPYTAGLTGAVNLGAFALEGFDAMEVQPLPLDAHYNPLAGSINLMLQPGQQRRQVGVGWASFGRWRGQAAWRDRKANSSWAVHYLGLFAADTFGFDINNEQGVRRNSRYRQHQVLLGWDQLLKAESPRPQRLRYRAWGGYSRQNLPGPVLTGNPNAGLGERFEQWSLFHFLQWEKPLSTRWTLLLTARHQQEAATVDALRREEYQLGQGWLDAQFLWQVEQALANNRKLEHSLTMDVQTAGMQLQGNNLALELQRTPAVWRLEGHLGAAYELTLPSWGARWENRPRLSGLLRLNAVDSQGVHLNGGARATLPLLPQGGLELVVSGGRSVRIPAFNELYYAGYGNSELEPESTWLTDAALYTGPWPRKSQHGLRLKVSGFWAATENKIISVPLSPVRWSTLQLGRTRSRGLELAVDYQWNQWVNAFVSYTRQDVRDATVTDGAWVPYSPPEILAGGLTGRWRNLSLTLNTQYNGWRYTSLQNDEFNFLPRFWTADLMLGWRPAVGPVLLDIQLTLQNLTNTRFALIQSFPMPGRMLQLSVGAKF